MADKCQHEDNNKKCRAYAVNGSNYCFIHDPASARQRAEARKKGGLNRRVLKRSEHRYISINSVKDIHSIIELAINDACSLEPCPANLKLIGYLAQVALKVLETGSLEDRINALDGQMKLKEEKYYEKENR